MHSGAFLRHRVSQVSFSDRTPNKSFQEGENRLRPPHRMEPGHAHYLRSRAGKEQSGGEPHTPIIQHIDDRVLGVRVGRGDVCVCVGGVGGGR